MTIEDIYRETSNPIDDPKVIKSLVEAYSESSKGLGGFYDKLTKRRTKNYKRGQHYITDSDQFYSTLFNKWKAGILSLSREQFEYLKKQGSFDDSFIKMRNYLLNVHDVTTEKDANEIFYGKKGDKELEDALDKYTWKAFGEGSGWEHVASRYLTGKKDIIPKTEHRLYLNTESFATYKMLNYLIEKMDKYKLSYYFKFDSFGDRDDTIVIYSSTENLPKYIEALREIKKEHPELFQMVKEPPILTGQIDGWIGYGSEPLKKPNGENQSFNGVRSELLEKVIDRNVKDWIIRNRNITVTYNGKQMLYIDYLVEKLIESTFETLNKNYEYWEKSENRLSQRENRPFDIKNVVKYMGFTRNDLNSDKFKSYITANIKKNGKSKILEVLYKGENIKNSGVEPIKIPVKEGRTVDVRVSDIKEILQQQAIKIADHDPRIISKIQSDIKNEAPKYDIVPEKFSFDEHVRKNMRVEKSPTPVQNINPKPAPKPTPTPVEKVSPRVQIELAINKLNLELATYDQNTNTQNVMRIMNLIETSNLTSKDKIELYNRLMIVAKKVDSMQSSGGARN